ncbi:MAG: hypothetical protein IT318_17075, partial [Anaerolineales bacterium]|nr:hypothetical protein [Anaerolineales bacterium]
MNLDDLDRLRSLDSTHIGSALDALPDEVGAAWGLAARQPLPDAWRAARHVLLAGVGNGALAAEFAAGLAAQECPVPLA